MSVLFVPTEVGGWRFHVTVVLLMLVPTAALVQVGDVRDPSRLAALETVVLAAGLLVAAVSMYVHHRVTSLDQSGWVCAAIATAAVPTVGFGLYAWSHAGAIPESLGPLLGYRLAQMVVVLACLVMARRSPVRVDPLALGLLVGLVLSAGRQFTVRAAGPTDPHAASLVLACVLLGLVTMVIGLPLLGIVALPVWLRARGFVALGLIGISTALDPVAARSTVAAIIGLVAVLAGSVLVASTAVAYAHLALISRAQELVDLEAELARVESGSKADRARLNEIDSTVAGIASASRLMMTTTHDLTEDRREVLSGMVAAEVARLQRITASAKTPVSVQPDD